MNKETANDLRETVRLESQFNVTTKAKLEVLAEIIEVGGMPTWLGKLMSETKGLGMGTRAELDEICIRVTPCVGLIMEGGVIQEYRANQPIDVLLFDEEEANEATPERRRAMEAIRQEVQDLALELTPTIAEGVTE